MKNPAFKQNKITDDIKRVRIVYIFRFKLQKRP